VQLIAIIFRSSLEREVKDLLAAMGVVAHTELPDVLGAGRAGTVADSFEFPGTNTLILTVLEHPEATRLTDALRDFRVRAVGRQGGAEVPLHVFVVPCAQVV